MTVIIEKEEHISYLIIFFNFTFLYHGYEYNDIKRFISDHVHVPIGLLLT